MVAQSCQAGSSSSSGGSGGLDAGRQPLAPPSPDAQAGRRAASLPPPPPEPAPSKMGWLADFQENLELSRCAAGSCSSRAPLRRSPWL